MSDFIYRDGQLFAEDVSLLEIAKQYNTPCYVYSNNTIQSRYLEFDSAFTSGQHLLCYAVKANSNISILNTFLIYITNKDFWFDGKQSTLIQNFFVKLVV